MPLPFPLLGLVLGVGAVLAIFAPFHLLLCWDLLLSIFQGQWTLAGIRIDYTDVIIGCLSLAIVIRAQASKKTRGRIPYLKAWFFLAFFLCAAYLVAPQNQDNLTDPFRVGYQLYRYCLKPLLYYPLVMILLRDQNRIEQVLTCMVIGYNICAIMAIRQGYSGVDAAPGPFNHGNAFASCLVAPFMISFGRLFMLKPTEPLFAFSLVSVGILARALLFCQSRAGIASIALSLMAFFVLLTFTPNGRKLVMQFAPFAVLAPIALFIIRPDILHRPSVQHAMSVTDGTKASTMQWRMVERWPHFINLALEKPILGTGTAVDLSLGEAANTPHNGYISLAVRYGFPVCFLYIYFGFNAFFNGLRGFFKTKIVRLRIFSITVASPMVGILAHNMIESTITAEQLLQNYFWLLIGLNALTCHYQEYLMTPAEKAAWLAKKQKEQPEDWFNGRGLPARDDGRPWNDGDNWEDDPAPSWDDGWREDDPAPVWYDGYDPAYVDHSDDDGWTGRVDDGEWSQGEWADGVAGGQGGSGARSWEREPDWDDRWDPERPWGGERY